MNQYLCILLGLEEGLWPIILLIKHMNKYHITRSNDFSFIPFDIQCGIHSDYSNCDDLALQFFHN